MSRPKARHPRDRRVRYRHVATVVLFSADERERPAETYPEGRHCRTCGCRLSIYHPKDATECWPCTAKASQLARRNVAGWPEPRKPRGKKR